LIFTNGCPAEPLYEHHMNVTWLETDDVITRLETFVMIKVPFRELELRWQCTQLTFARHGVWTVIDEESNALSSLWHDVHVLRLCSGEGRAGREKVPAASFRAQAQSCVRAATKQPAGQITGIPVQPLAQKYSA
jgi:hypothetical protein